MLWKSGGEGGCGLYAMLFILVLAGEELIFFVVDDAMLQICEQNSVGKALVF